MMRAGLLASLAILLPLSASRAQSPAPAAGYRIAGKVVNADSGAPLGGVEVAIVPVVDGLRPPPDEDGPPRRGRRGGRPQASALQSATTTDDGAFVFASVPAGKYSLEGSRRGFITASYQEHGFYSTAIVTGAGLPTEGLILKLSPGAVIGGSLIDAAGDPLEQATVNLYRLSDDGLGTVRMYRGGNADDLGAYEFAHLPPGTYFVSARARVWYGTVPQQAAPIQNAAAVPVAVPSANLDLVYPRAYYADATDSNAATPIPVRGGEHLRIDLHLQAVPAVHLSYSLPPNTSDGGNGFQAVARPPILFQSVFGERDPASDQVTYRDDHGRPSFSLSIAPGEYDVEVAGRSLSVNAGGDTVLDPTTGSLPVDITGKIAAAAGATLPEPVDLLLRPSDAQGGGGALSTAAHEGAFHFEEARPGRYEIEVHAQGRPMAIVQMAASGAQVEGHLLRVGTQPVTFAATVAPASALVSGFARATSAEGDQAASGAMVVLVPQHLGDHALYRRDQSDSDGSFTLRQVAPGKYTLVAIRDGWDLDWARPEVIAHYLPAGQAITVAGSDSRTLRLDKPVMVQAR